eukprot:Gb_08678 [translate_table: standard]
MAPRCDTSHWLIEVKEKLRIGGNKIKLNCECIFAVPESLRKERPEAYVPRVVSLGPFHHLKSEFSRSEKYKTELTLTVQERAKGKLFENLVEEIISKCEEIRKSYDQDIACNDEELGWMMAQDALFLLEILRSDFDKRIPEKTHRIPQHFLGIFDPKRKGPVLLAIHADILKMENQMPMFVLDKVLTWETGSEKEALEKLGRMLTVACNEFSPFLNDVDYEIRPILNQPINGEHLLDYLYKTIVPPPISSESNSEGSRIDSKMIYRTGVDLPSASELQSRGVKFFPFVGHLTKIKFDRKLRTFFLPVIRMDDRTEVVLRNLVAHEAFIELESRALASYVDLMDRLIDTPIDVGILKKCGIIRSDMGSDNDVADAWNGIGRSMWKSGYEPVDIAIHDVNDYYKSNYKLMLGEYLQENFSKPWRAVSVVVGSVVLFLTFLRFYFFLEQRYGDLGKV